MKRLALFTPLRAQPRVLKRDSHTGLDVKIDTKIPNGSLTVDAFVRKINERID